MRRDVVGSRSRDDEVRATIKRVYEERGYLLDPHSAIAYMGLKAGAQAGRTGGREIGVFLATAHPAKFARSSSRSSAGPIEKPAPLAEALAQPRHILRISASFDAVRRTLDG